MQYITEVTHYEVIFTDSGTSMSFIQTGVRTYFPRLGRYMQIDPIKDGLNWVAYTDNNPVNSMDPNGKMKCNSSTLGDPKGSYSYCVCMNYAKQNFRECLWKKAGLTAGGLILSAAIIVAGFAIGPALVSAGIITSAGVSGPLLVL